MGTALIHTVVATVQYQNVTASVIERVFNALMNSTIYEHAKVPH